MIDPHSEQLLNVMMSQMLVRHRLISSFLCHRGSSYTITWLTSTDEMKRKEEEMPFIILLVTSSVTSRPRTDSETGKSIQVFQFIVFSNNLQFWDKSRYTIT